MRLENWEDILTGRCTAICIPKRENEIARMSLWPGMVIEIRSSTGRKKLQLYESYALQTPEGKTVGRIVLDSIRLCRLWDLTLEDYVALNILQKSDLAGSDERKRLAEAMKYMERRWNRKFHRKPSWHSNPEVWFILVHSERRGHS